MTIEKVRRYDPHWYIEEMVEEENGCFIEASEVDGLVVVLKDVRDALHQCIDALSSEEESDHEALDALTKAIARFAK